MYSLKGHKGLITQCSFMKSQNVLITRWVMSNILISAHLFLVNNCQISPMTENANELRKGQFDLQYWTLNLIFVPTVLFWTGCTYIYYSIYLHAVNSFSLQKEMYAKVSSVHGASILTVKPKPDRTATVYKCSLIPVHMYCAYRCTLFPTKCTWHHLESSAQTISLPCLLRYFNFTDWAYDFVFLSSVLKTVL